MYSFDFLTCDQDQWISVHLTLPFFIMFMTHNFILTWFAAFVFEAFEVLLVSVFGNFALFFQGREQVSDESIAASYLGDALFQGFAGAVLGSMFIVAFRPPKLFTKFTWDKGPHARKQRELWFKALGFVAIYAALNLSVGWTIATECGDFYIGIPIVTAAHALFLYFYVELWTENRWDDLYIWRNNHRLRAQPDFKNGRDGQPLRMGQRRLIFLWFWLSELWVNLQNFLPQWLPSIYLQTWIAAAVLLIVYYIVWLQQYPPTPVGTPLFGEIEDPATKEPETSEFFLGLGYPPLAETKKINDTDK